MIKKFECLGLSFQDLKKLNLFFEKNFQSWTITGAMRPSCQPPTSAAPTSNPQMFPNQFWKKLKVDLKVREKHFPILPAIGKPKFNLHFCTLDGVTFL